MAKEYIQDRLLPCLLDRLADHAPDQRSETVGFKNYSVKQLRESVLRDLSWLFNATSNKFISENDINIEIQNSVLNYGMPALSGSFVSGISISELKQQIRQAIVTFEPRIIPDSVQVIAINESKGGEHNQVSFNIKAQLWAQPLPIELLIKSEIDLETGETSVVEVNA